MKARLTSLFDPILMADGHHKGHLTFLLKDFARLAEEIVNPEQSVEVAIAFRRLERMPVLEGQLKTTLRVTCQRCLEPMEIDINEPLRLCFIESSGLEESVPEGFDAYDFVQDEKLNLVELIEDELLLSLPDVPMHADCEVPAAYQADAFEDEVSEQKPNPFAQLAALKKTSH